MRQIVIDFGTLEFLGMEIPLRVLGYGLMLVCGFLLAVTLTRWRARRAGEDPDNISRIGLVALVAGVLGARLAYVIMYWSHFANSDDLLGSILDITSGGLIYFGGLILATVAVIGFIVLRRRPVRRYIDIVAVGVMLGLAFGRAGCLMNGCCWGSRCRDDWTLAARFPMYSHPLLKLGGDTDNVFSEGTIGPSPVYSHQRAAHPDDLKVNPLLTDGSGGLIRPSDFTPEQIDAALASHSLWVKPAQILGFFNALILATILTLFYRMRRREGQVFALMLVLYPITRFLLEMIRADNEHDISRLILTHNQITSLVMFLGGIGLFVLLGRLPASVGPTMAQLAGATACRSKNH